MGELPPPEHMDRSAAWGLNWESVIRIERHRGQGARQIVFPASSKNVTELGPVASVAPVRGFSSCAEPHYDA